LLGLWHEVETETETCYALLGRATIKTILAKTISTLLLSQLLQLLQLLQSLLLLHVVGWQHFIRMPKGVGPEVKPQRAMRSEAKGDKTKADYLLQWLTGHGKGQTAVSRQEILGHGQDRTEQDRIWTWTRALFRA